MKSSLAFLLALGSVLALLTLALGCADDAPSAPRADVGSNNQDDASGGDGGQGDASNSHCVDLDNDGFVAGNGCPEANDCNDQNAAINPGAEDVCGDRTDNNCDGNADEGCPCAVGSSRLCSSVGDPLTLTIEMRCRPGIQYCVNGQWESACQGEVGPAEELCNNVDDDCDGEVDEELLNSVGECADVNPDPVEDCGSTGEGNGLDDNGDGQVDEGCSCAVPGFDPELPRTGQPCYGGPVETLGVGICKGGTRDCGSDGTWGPCNGQVLPAQETCGDQIDNDCDGVYDETCPTCVATGEEICDGLDNDCNGAIDEGVRNTCGGCGAVADDEACGDGLDNNCNGVVDEGCGCTGQEQQCYPGPPEAAGMGQCAFGTQTCQNEFWGTCTGYVLPQLEGCGLDGMGNGLDEDCDGSVDEGCGCTDGATRPCGTDTGTCERGIETCQGNQWGACTDGVGPGAEVCDGQDNNCDGLTDEELLNACGTCGESCYLLPVDPVAEGEPDEGIFELPADDPENPTGRSGISLSKSSFLPPYLWAANHDYDTVTKFNTDLEEEEGIYWVGDNPSRTGVDLDGNMWVGGRNDGRLTKVLWDTTACPDRNGNGVVDTSRNQAGVVAPVNSAADPFADECVVYSAVPGPASIRGVAAAADGKVWIGYSAGGVQSIDPNTFELGPFISPNDAPYWTMDANGVFSDTGTTSTTGGVYGLVVDSNGHLYTSSYNRATLARFDTATETWVAVYQLNGQCSYGIAVDAQNRIWRGGWPQCAGVMMFDPDEVRAWTFTVPSSVPNPPPYGGTALATVTPGVAPIGNGAFYVTGVGVEPATGDVWMSFYPIGYTGRLRVDDNDFSQSTFTFIGTLRNPDNTRLATAIGNDLRGVGFDRNGFAWTLGLGSTHVYKIDPATNARASSMPSGRPIGQGTHYTYSDFTGSTALSFTAPRGFWRYVFSAEFDEAQVDAVAWDAFVPMETSAGLRIRSLDSEGTPTSSWLPPDDMGVPNYFEYPAGEPTNRINLATNGGPLVGPRFEVEIRLTTSNRDFRPIVHDVRLEWQRP